MEIASIISLNLISPVGIILIVAFVAFCVLQMCDVRAALANFTPHHRGKTIAEIFPDLHLKTSFQWQNVRSGHCMYCNKPMSDGERYPGGGLMPRCMCQQCYNALITSRVNEYCILSGYKLPDNYISLQKQNPREVQWNILPRKHWEYYLLAANKALGRDVSYIRKDYTKAVQGSLFDHHSEPIRVHPIHAEPDYVEGEIVEELPASLRVAGITRQMIEHQPVRELEYVHQKTVDDWRNQTNKPEEEPILVPAKRR